MLAALHQRYAPRGFRVLGFPCNDFAKEEPDDLPVIQDFCSRTYGVTYEIFDKVRIRPPYTHPLYAWLTTAAPQRGPVKWNFEKFLISRRGAVVGRWESSMEPDARRVIRAIEREIALPAPTDR